MLAALSRSDARIVGAGAIDRNDRVARVEPGEHELDRFEIGSITKVITGTVLARLVLDGATSLNRQIGDWLDAGENGTITLEELATHTSGLPRLAPNAFTHADFDKADPYARFDAALAEEGVRTASRSEIGKYAYSNFGYQLLGLCIERLTGRPLRDLFDEVVLGPAGMTGATTDHSLPVLTGEDDSGPVANWTLVLQGPGGVNGTIHDLLALAEAVLAPRDDRLGEALRFALQPRADGPGAKVGLGWALHPAGIACCGGGTAGFSTYIAAHVETGRGVAVAINRYAGELVQSVALAAAAGQDPEAVVPSPFEGDPAPFEERALELFRQLAAQNFEGARELMRPETADSLTLDRLRAGWTQVAASCGELGDPAATEIARTRGAVQVTVVAPGSAKSLTLRAFLDDAQRVAGVTVA